MFTGHTQYLAVGGGNCSLSSYSPLIFELPKTWIIKAKGLDLGSVEKALPLESRKSGIEY